MDKMYKVPSIIQIEYLQIQIAKSERKWHETNSTYTVMKILAIMGILVRLLGTEANFGGMVMSAGALFVLIAAIGAIYSISTLKKLESEIDAQHQQVGQLRIELAELADEEVTNPDGDNRQDNPDQTTTPDSPPLP